VAHGWSAEHLPPRGLGGVGSGCFVETPNDCFSGVAGVGAGGCRGADEQATRMNNEALFTVASNARDPGS